MPRSNPFAALAEPDGDLLLSQPPFPLPAPADEDRTLSTTQAAAILGVSRATMVRYCEDGRVPYTQPGKHRRLRLKDVLAFKAETTHGRVAS